MVIILLACRPYVVIVNCLGQVSYLGRAPRTKETLPDFRECRVGYPTSTSIPRVDGLSTDTLVFGHHKLYYIGSCYQVFFLQVVFWVELSVQRRLCPIFIKSRVPKKGTRWCGVGLSDIHMSSAG